MNVLGIDSARHLSQHLSLFVMELLSLHVTVNLVICIYVMYLHVTLCNESVV